MTKEQVYKLIRDPSKWDDDFFQSAAELPDKNTKTLLSIVRRELPGHVQDFEKSLFDAFANADSEKLLKNIQKYNVPSAASISPQEVKWIFKPYIPRGKLTLIAANPGTGKTFLMCYVAAAVSTGKAIFKRATLIDGAPAFTDGMDYSGEKPGRVLYITAEDGAADTLRPRLEWCGADLKRVYIRECETDSLTFSSRDFREIVETVRPDLVICDPFQAFFSSRTDLNRANETRAQLFPVIKLAAETGAAIVLICHLNKDRQGGIISRVLGSMDIVGACRSFLAVGNVPGKPVGLKFISHEKSSLARHGKTYLFTLDPTAGGVLVQGETDLSFDDYAAIERAARKKSGEKTDTAKQFIVDNMPNGSRPYRDLLQLATDNGITEWSLKKAGEDLHIIKKRSGFPSVSVWYLPGHDPESQTAQYKTSVQTN